MSDDEGDEVYVYSDDELPTSLHGHGASMMAESWTCAACTLENPSSLRVCDACGENRPGYLCPFCGTTLRCDEMEDHASLCPAGVASEPLAALEVGLPSCLTCGAEFSHAGSARLHRCSGSSGALPHLAGAARDEAGAEAGGARVSGGGGGGGGGGGARGGPSRKHSETLPCPYCGVEFRIESLPAHCDSCDSIPAAAAAVLEVSEEREEVYPTSESEGAAWARRGGGGGGAAAAAAAPHDSCPFCGEPFVEKLPMFRNYHADVCPGLREESVVGGGGGGDLRDLRCPFCRATFSLFEALIEHSPSCPSLPARFKGASAPMGLLSGAPGFGDTPLTPKQAAALAFVHSYASRAHAEALPKLRARVLALGLGAEAVDKTLAYVRDRAPLIIHFKPGRLSLFTMDTHYRNQFETKTSCGTLSRSARETWENRLFGGSYSCAEDGERVKYGCLNFFGDQRGDMLAAPVYGDCYFLLKEEVRVRATFANMDSSQVANKGGGQGLSTCENFAHVLLDFREDELRLALRVGCGTGVDATLGVQGTARAGSYKEVQVHGPLRFAQDVALLVVPELQRSAVADAAAAFSEKFRVPILWTS